MKIISILVLLATLALSACNTMEGIGRDFKQAGQALEESARSNK
jgi:entericidin B